MFGVEKKSGIDKKLVVFQRRFVNKGNKKLINMWVVPARIWRAQRCRDLSLKIRRPVAGTLGKKNIASLNFFAEVENVELCKVALGRKDVHEARRRQMFEAGSSKEVRRLPGAVCCEMRDADIPWPALDVLSVDGKSSDCRIIAPSDVEEHLINKR